MSRVEELRREFEALPDDEQDRRAAEFRKDIEADRNKPAKIWHVLGVVDGFRKLLGQREEKLIDRIVACESRLGAIEDTLRRTKE